MVLVCLPPFPFHRLQQYRVETEVDIGLTVKPQPHFFASPPTFASEASVSDSTEQVQDGRITHLAFLEDTELATTETSLHVGSESAVDLRLLVVCTSSSSRQNFGTLNSLGTDSFCVDRYSQIFFVQLLPLARTISIERSVRESRMQESRRIECRSRRMGESSRDQPLVTLC